MNDQVTRSRALQLLRLLRIALSRPLLVFGLGFGMAWLIFADSGTKPADPGEKTNAGPAAASVWTCSMHPQIRRDGPGNCPLCGMKLVPVTATAGGGMRTITISPMARKLMQIETSPVERRYVSTEVRMVGKVEYDETRVSRITAWVPGRLDRMFVDHEGVSVDKGVHLFSIYSEELYSAQEELIRALKFKRERQETRPKTTVRIDLVESSREKLRLLGLTAEQIQEVEERDEPSEQITIHSPIGGIVVEKLKQQGDRVRTGDRVYTVADLSRVWVKLDAYESDLVWLQYGQDVSFTTEAYPGETFEGRIALIDPVLNKSTRTVKVRVNVANADGKLKPEMFVRAVVKADVAAGGRVLSADLAGKWVSPMHPEIVSDTPGNCSVCGMPLVRAESLGYVTATTDDRSRPLVIPVSAALVTGTRAIVYVEHPTAEQPTFEGREILLGPRAGNYYLVRSGLQEGELVVTNGNFKLDSALQIQAKPSMMTPEGGGGGSHDHGRQDKNRSPASEGSEPSTMDVPESLRQQLGDVVSAHDALTKAIEASELSRIRAAFNTLGDAVQAVDTDEVTGHAAMLWEEFAMLLSNDAAEGLDVSRLSEADRIYLLSKRHLQRMREQFGLVHGDHHKHAVVLLEVPAEFRGSLGKLWGAYQSQQVALAANEFSQFTASLPLLREALNAIDSAELTDDAASVWQSEVANLNSIFEQLDKAANLETGRAAFALLSDEMLVLAKTFGFGDGSVWEVHCPMAFNDRGATWLQPDKEVRNPYFGPAMLKCADRVTEIRQRPPPDTTKAPAGHKHE